MTDNINNSKDKYSFNIIDDELGYARLYGYIKGDKLQVVSQALIDKYEKQADKFWDQFYKNNNNNFFKDRHWLIREFPEFLKNQDKQQCKENEINVFEIGCGVGNTTLPLMELNDNLNFVSFDFSQHAVGLLNQSVENNPKFKNRCKAFVYSATDSIQGLPDYVVQGSFDIIVIIFVLSAMDPKTMPAVVDMCHYALKPGGIVLIRDYAVDDMAQNRFDSNNIEKQLDTNSGGKNKLGDNFHVRFDGTRAYYFSLEFMESLYSEKGFKTLENKFVEKVVVNRKDNNSMERKFIQSKFIK